MVDWQIVVVGMVDWQIVVDMQSFVDRAVGFVVWFAGAGYKFVSDTNFLLVMLPAIEVADLGLFSVCRSFWTAKTIWEAHSM